MVKETLLVFVLVIITSTYVSDVKNYLYGSSTGLLVGVLGMMYIVLLAKDGQQVYIATTAIGISFFAIFLSELSLNQNQGEDNLDYKIQLQFLDYRKLALLYVGFFRVRDWVAGHYLLLLLPPSVRLTSQNKLAS